MSVSALHYPAKIVPFIEYLQGLTTRPPIDDLVAKMKKFDISMQELGSFVQFHDRGYRRNVVFENEHVQLLCLCWKSGQRSPIHDHAQSICAVKIVEGVASETLFEMTPSGYIKAVSTVDYGEGVIGSEDDDTHQVANLQEEGQDLVTLHCYAPPLRKMKTYSIDSKFSQMYEPVNEMHIYGSGI
ncbi:Cysteine dioxygenase type I [Rubritalea squalenifaciens DSM 18772]|uniref:Cysteine dioxygenase type I n=1 Tax=Rubritalea squalenifaciens DSM 18772 TaxID=1123071 RepID=A0A1M6GLI9_9BACT|nr:cysteine dioxygenase family protein [Rubritalea squalenifaciens]SHJ10804.1 Cysteine dioxygenase type I [Rubritalea squalenifaciens DSM 18772]